MNLSTVRAVVIALLLPVVATSAFALSGDAAAILEHCGPPSSDQVLHKGTPQMERMISYADTELYFAPLNGDWSFAYSRVASIPLRQDALFASMHCVSDALEEIAARPPQTVNFAANSNPVTVVPKVADHNSIFLWAFVLVFAGALFFAIRPYARSAAIQPAAQVAPRSPQRRPSATGVKFRKPDGVQPDLQVAPKDDSTNTA